MRGTRATRAAIAIAVAALAASLALLACRKRAAAPRKHRGPPPAAWPALADLPLGHARWLVDLDPPASVPDLVAHPPLFVGDRIVVSGSRIGYVALDAATGAVAWRRPSSPSLGNPVMVADELVLVHDCEGEVAAPPGRLAIACFDRVDPHNVAARRAGVVTLAATDACVPSLGAWHVRLAGWSSRTVTLVLDRGDCNLAMDYPSGEARRAPRPPTTPPDPPGFEIVWRDPQRWLRETHDGKSFVHDSGRWRVPGLTLLAAAGGAAVVRLDATLRNDYVLSLVDGWRWPLPPPADVRSTPVGVASRADTVIVVFDGNRVAALTAP